jgi:ribosomal protein L37E
MKVIEQVKCNRCGYEWFPRTPDVLPKGCAKCNSPYYAKERIRPIKESKPAVNKVD